MNKKAPEEARGGLQLRVGQEAISALVNVAKECHLAIDNAPDQFTQGFAMAEGIRRLGELITEPMMQDVMALQGQALGFRTDKDLDKFGNKSEGYPLETVKQVFIEATIRGFRPVGNELNIIAGRFYGCKAGFVRLVKEFPGLADFEATMGDAEIKGATAHVPFIASWRLNGQPMRFERRQRKLPDGSPFDDRIPVRVNERMGIDAIFGKATRKAFAAIYDVLTDSRWATPEGELDDAIPVQSKPAPQASSLFSEEPADPTADEDRQAQLRDEYRDQIAQADSKKALGDLARHAGKNGDLSEAGRKAVMSWINERGRELS